MQEEVHKGFWCGNVRERDHLEDPGVDGKIILKFIFRKWDGSKDWNDLVQDRDGWQALVNVVVKLQVTLNVGNLLTSCEPVVFSRWTLLN